MEYDLFGNEIIEKKSRAKNIKPSANLQTMIDKINNFDELESAFRALQSKFDEMKNSKRIIENDSFAEQFSFENEELRRLGRKGLDEVSSDGRSSADATPESSIDEPRKLDGELRETRVDNKLNSQQVLSTNNEQELGTNQRTKRSSNDSYNGSDNELFGEENNTSSIRSGDADIGAKQQSMESVSIPNGVSTSENGVSGDTLPDLDISQMDFGADKQESRELHSKPKSARDENISSINTRTNENRIDDLFAESSSDATSNWGDTTSSVTRDENGSVLRSMDETSSTTHDDRNKRSKIYRVFQNAQQYTINTLKSLFKPILEKKKFIVIYSDFLRYTTQNGHAVP